MEHYISNAAAQAIIDKVMVPLFRSGDFAGGLRAGLLPLMDDARKFQIRDPSPSVEAAAQTPDPRCTFLTAQVASAVLHGPAKLWPYGSWCNWHLVDDHFVSFIHFEVHEGVTMFTADPMNHEIVKDVGESAFWYSAPGAYRLDAYAKHRVVSVWIYGSYAPSGETMPINDRSGCAAVAADILRHP